GQFTGRMIGHRSHLLLFLLLLFWYFVFLAEEQEQDFIPQLSSASAGEPQLRAPDRPGPAPSSKAGHRRAASAARKVLPHDSAGTAMESRSLPATRASRLRPGQNSSASRGSPGAASRAD